MARRTVLKETVEEQSKLEEDDPFELAREEFGPSETNQVRLEVYRYNAAERTKKWLKGFAFDPELHNHDYLRAKWGPGAYQLRFRNKKLQWSRTVDIAPDGPEVSSPSAASAPAGLTSEKFLEMLLQERQMFLNAILNNRQAPSAPGDGNTLVAKILEGQTSLINTLLQQNMKGADTTGSMLSAFEKLTQLIGDAKLNDEGGLLATIRSLARDVLPVVNDAIKASRMPAPLARNLPAGAPAPINGAAVPQAQDFVNTEPASPKEPDMQTLIDHLIRQYLPYVKQAAESQHDPEDLAGEILDQIPRAQHEHFDSITADRILALDGGLEPYRAWVEELVQNLHGRDAE